MKKLLFIAIIFLFVACQAQTKPDSAVAPKKFAVDKSVAALKKKLDPIAYQVTCNEATEKAFSGKYWDNHQTGTYHCAVCGAELFSSTTKFESGSGWPSFYQPLKKTAILEEADKSFGMDRTKVTCSHCGAHLGHLFADGPNPTGLRYCVNSASLNFIKK